MTNLIGFCNANYVVNGRTFSGAAAKLKIREYARFVSNSYFSVLSG